MKTFSARTLIDDILLIVRNNNISESEDMSRDQILSWIMQYKAYLSKKEDDKDSETGYDEDPDDSQLSTIGPLELIDDPVPGSEDSCCCDCCNYGTRKRTKNKIHTMEDSSDDIVNVTDASGCVIQIMNKSRKHYHNFRRYTYNEPTCWFDDQYVYVDGDGVENFKYIYVTGMFDPTQTAGSEDEITIPGWMIPDIKRAIMTNELAFMLKRPSDDSNNSTLASVKPNGPQDKEE